MMLKNKIACLPLLVVAVCAAQNTLPPLPAPLGVPAPGPSTDGPYAPLPILPGGVVVTLYPPGSPFLSILALLSSWCRGAPTALRPFAQVGNLPKTGLCGHLSV
jgi:hypothetical protein